MLLGAFPRDVGSVCVQGTKACLGWEGSPAGGTYASTAVTDTWLDLLQLAFCATRRLPQAVPTLASSRRATAELDAKPGDAVATSRRATAELDVRLGNALASYSGALQDLLRQLLQHWKVQTTTL